MVARHLWPCQFLAFPWDWLPVVLGFGLLLSAFELIRRSPDSFKLVVFPICASLLGIVVSIRRPGPDECPPCMEIREVAGVDAGSVNVRYPGQVPCEFLVSGLVSGHVDVYVFSRPLGGSFPLRWLRHQGSGGGTVESDRTVYEWGSIVNLCAAGRDTLHELAATAVEAYRPPPEHPSHAPCISTSEFVVTHRSSDEATAVPQLEFYVGDRSRRLDRIDSPVVIANVFYHGFAEPVAWIDWGDGRNWERSSTTQDEMQFITHQYEEAGEKKIKFRVVESMSDKSIETSARITVAGQAPSQSVRGQH